MWRDRPTYKITQLQLVLWHFLLLVEASDIVQFHKSHSLHNQHANVLELAPFCLFVMLAELNKKMDCTLHCNPYLYTASCISGKQTGGSHHSVAITVMEAQYLVCLQLPIKNLPGEQPYLAMNNLVFKTCFLPNVYLIEQMGHYIALTIPQPRLHVWQISVTMMQSMNQTLQHIRCCIKAFWKVTF